MSRLINLWKENIHNYIIDYESDYESDDNDDKKSEADLESEWSCDYPQITHILIPYIKSLLNAFYIQEKEYKKDPYATVAPFPTNEQDWDWTWSMAYINPNMSEPPTPPKCLF